MLHRCNTTTEDVSLQTRSRKNKSSMRHSVDDVSRFPRPKSDQVAFEANHSHHTAQYPLLRRIRTAMLPSSPAAFPPTVPLDFRVPGQTSSLAR